MRRLREFPLPTTFRRDGSLAIPPVLGAGLAALILLALLGACHHAGTTAQRPKEIIDYRNGWYHKATGSETIEAISEHYRRDPALVAEINRSGGPYAIPEAGKMLYIPPSNDRIQVREVLTRLQGHPELIPKTPWDPALAVLAGPNKTAAPNNKVRVGDKAPMEPEAVQVRVLPSSGGKVRVNEEFDPPPPGRKEIAIVEPKAPAPKPSFWNWLTGSPESRKVIPKPAPAPTPVPRPIPQPNGFLWPVKGKIITPYKGGWHNACHGIEIAAAEGTPVHAARDGMVLLAQNYPGYGNLVLIDHGDGFATAYGYNDQMLVHEGDRVQRGQTIASVGRPTQGSSAKLLFQVRRNALPVDPLPLMKDS